MHTAVQTSITSARARNWDQNRQVAEQRLCVYEGDYLYQLLDLIKSKIAPETWQLWKDRRFWNEIDNVSSDVIGKTVKLYRRQGYRAF